MSVFKHVQFRDWIEDNEIIVDVNTYEKIYRLWEQVSKYRQFVEEFVDAWEYGVAGDSSIYRSAVNLLEKG